MIRDSSNRLILNIISLETQNCKAKSSKVSCHHVRWRGYGILFDSIPEILVIMQKGSIRVQTENIFPIIKKFLYSDHEIFLRELVSNAVDATQKLKTLSSLGEAKGELGDLAIDV